MAEDYSLPKVTKRGLLTKAHPIRNRGDISRSRVLPPPEPDSAPAAEKIHQRFPAKDDALRRREPVSERPQGALDYVGKRNKLLREISGRR
jgi:hypothetical protein